MIPRALVQDGWLASTAARVVLAVAAIAIAGGAWTFARAGIADLEASLAGRLEQTARLRSAAEQSRQILAATPNGQEATLAGDFLSGSQDSIIVAELQQRLRALAIANNVEFNSANALPVRDGGNISYLGLRVQVRGQLRDIQSVLHAAEAGSPLLFVERLAMRVDTWPIKSADPNLDGAPAMVAEIDLVGARQPAVGSGKPAGGGESGGDGAATGGPQVPWLSTKGGRS